jgi:hypothetical protein
MGQQKRLPTYERTDSIYRRDHDKYNLEILGVLRDEPGIFLAVVFIFGAMMC